ncbi:hypothetical protein CRUP_023171, partial [Coryphaenoides rupestris]
SRSVAQAALRNVTRTRRSSQFLPAATRGQHTQRDLSIGSSEPKSAATINPSHFLLSSSLRDSDPRDPWGGGGMCVVEGCVVVARVVLVLKGQDGDHPYPQLGNPQPTLPVAVHPRCPAPLPLALPPVFSKVKSRSAHMKSHSEAGEESHALRLREAEERAAAVAAAARRRSPQRRPAGRAAAAAPQRHTATRGRRRWREYERGLVWRGRRRRRRRRRRQ